MKKPDEPALAGDDARTELAKLRAVVAGKVHGAELGARDEQPSRKEAREAAPRVRGSLSRRARRRAQRSVFVASLEARGARGCRPRDFRARTIAGVRSIFENRTGREARLALNRFPRHMRAQLMHVARNPGNGRVLNAQLNEVWSRWVISVAYLLKSERRKSFRNGARSVVDGFSQGMLCALFRNRDGKTYSRSRVFGTSYRRGSEECSPFVALERAGIVWKQQPRTTEANPRFIGPPHVQADGSSRRFAFAVYWLRALAPP
jgi:hypothetical protein